MKEDLNLIDGYLWGVGITVPVFMLIDNNPLKIFFLMLAIHPIVMIGIILLRKKYNVPPLS